MASGTQSTGKPSSSEQVHPSKQVDPKAFAGWIARSRKKPVENSSDEATYQRTHAGPAEIEVSSGDVTVRADGARVSDAHLLETKHIGSPDSSPYIPGSRCPECVRNMIRQSLVDQFLRYAIIIRDPATPAVGLEVITNDERAIIFFETLLRETSTPGRVVIKP
jgi:restriction endonuclease fold toxin 2 of polymorphic toxin system